jgi:hypothetical protein
MAAILFVCGCSPAITEGSYALDGAPGLFLSDAGGNERIILIDAPGNKKTILLDARVNDYVVDKGRLYVSRSPRVFQKDAAGHLIGHIEQHCEYWSINIGDGALRREREGVQDLRCPAENAASKTGAWIAK